MTDVVKASRTSLPPARSIHWNPSPEELRELTSRMPNARLTEFGNFNVQTRVVSRSKSSTYIITDSPDEHTDQTLSREVGDHIAQLQESHIRDRDMPVIDGYIGNDPGYRVRARLYIDAAKANIAAMERWLYFDNEGQGGDSWDPALTVKTRWRVNLESRGFDLHHLPRWLSFEGAGDALFLGTRLFFGAGFRTDREAHAIVAEILGVDHVSLDLVDPRFYHLDTCFCPLDSETALCALGAFSEASKRIIQEQVPNLIPVPAQIAAQVACNAMPVGRTVVSSVSIGALQQPLAAAGFDVVGVSMTEFMKSGGGVRCLSLPLDAGRSASAT
jgi:hypothetical protein